MRHKFFAKSCERDGIKFPSKLEGACYDILKEKKAKGDILFFLRQIPFDLPGKRIHRVDFCVFFKNEMIFVEVKGRDLPMGKMKREQVESIYPVEIFVVKSTRELLDLLDRHYVMEH